jgi:hypothetical protein
VASGDKVFTDGVQGKVVDRILVGDDGEEMLVEVRFTDNTSFNVRMTPGMVELEGIDILGWKAGNSRVLRKLL